jgi:hypothetical protein
MENYREVLLIDHDNSKKYWRIDFKMNQKKIKNFTLVHSAGKAHEGFFSYHRSDNKFGFFWINNVNAINQVKSVFMFVNHDIFDMTQDNVVITFRHSVFFAHFSLQKKMRLSLQLVTANL